MHDLFHRFAQNTSAAVGSPWAFASAVTAIVIWALTGPVVGFSTTWQLVINTATTIVTFLIVFLIQNTQNRESRAIQLKLDELILANDRARNQVILADKDSEKELADLEADFDKVAAAVPDRPGRGEPKGPSKAKPAPGAGGATADLSRPKRAPAKPSTATGAGRNSR
jgi:low affinity Fe/Cu permease